MLNSDVTVNLTGGNSIGAVAEHVPVFVMPNVVTSQAALTAIPYTECTSLDDVVAAGFSTTSKLYKAVQLFRMQPDKPKKFAIYGSTKSNVSDAVMDIINEDWRQLITVDLGTSTLEEVGDVVESADSKQWFISIRIANAATMTDAAFASAWAEATEMLTGYDRTIIMYYDDSVDTPEAAIVGATAALDAGSFTYKNLILKGITPLKLNEARVNAITGTAETAHGITIVRKAGDIVTTSGFAASGEYIDVIDSYDWIIEHITYDVQKVFNQNHKVPFTNPGVVQLENATLSVLKTAFANGMIAPTADNDKVGDYSTDFIPASEMTSEQRATRHYDGGNFSFTLAGAIHTATINGTIAA